MSPSQLTPRVLSSSDREALKETCAKMLSKVQGMGNIMTAITEFVDFCLLLSKPENHIHVATGQYIQRQYNTRSFLDMEAEMAQALANLPKYTAYAKIIKEQAGVQIVLKRKIQTIKLPPPVPEMDELKRTILNRSYSLYYRERRHIEEDLRQKEKRRLCASLPPSPDTKGKKQSAPESTGPQARSELDRRDEPPERNDTPPSSSSDQPAST